MMSGGMETAGYQDFVKQGQLPDKAVQLRAAPMKADATRVSAA